MVRDRLRAGDPGHHPPGALIPFEQTHLVQKVNCTYVLLVVGHGSPSTDDESFEERRAPLRAPVGIGARSCPPPGSVRPTHRDLPRSPSSAKPVSERSAPTRYVRLRPRK